MLLDFFAKTRQFGVYTFLVFFCVAEFYWTEIIQVAAHQYGETVTDKQVHTKDWSSKIKENPVNLLRQIDYVFKQF